MTRNKTAALIVAFMPACVLAMGCDDVLQDLDLGTTRINFINNGDHPVQVLLAIDDNASTGDDVIDDVGTQSAYTVEPGVPLDVSFGCRQIQSVKVIEAELQVNDIVEPTTSSDTLRDDVNFNCGDTIIFTFDHSILLLDFNVEVAVDTN